MIDIATILRQDISEEDMIKVVIKIISEEEIGNVSIPKYISTTNNE